MTAKTSIHIEFSDGATISDATDGINDYLTDFETAIFPLDLTNTPEGIQKLVAQSDLTDDQTAVLMKHFLLPRERLLEIVAASGRQPNVAGGGELKVFDATHDYYYPNLWAVKPGIDYGRFDRFHINTDDDGVGIDEVCQLIWGAGVVVRRRAFDGREMSMRVACPHQRAGWIIVYNGGTPHIGSLSSAQPGTKLVVQVFGPPRFQMRYVE